MDGMNSQPSMDFQVQANFNQIPDCANDMISPGLPLIQEQDSTEFKTKFVQRRRGKDLIDFKPTMNFGQEINNEELSWLIHKVNENMNGMSPTIPDMKQNNDKGDTSTVLHESYRQLEESILNNH